MDAVESGAAMEVADPPNDQRCSCHLGPTRLRVDPDFGDVGAGNEDSGSEVNTSWIPERLRVNDVPSTTARAELVKKSKNSEGGNVSAGGPGAAMEQPPCDVSPPPKVSVFGS